MRQSLDGDGAGRPGAWPSARRGGRLAACLLPALCALGLSGGQAWAQALPLPDFGDDVPPVSGGPSEAERAEREDQDAVSEESGRASTATVTTTVSTVIQQALQPAIGALRAPAVDTERSARAGALRRRIGQAGSEPLFGLGTGAVWASAGATFVDNDFAGNPFEGEVLNPLVGADITSPDGWVAGLSLGYEGSDLDTAFNDGRLEGDGVLISPYAGYVLAPFALVDAAVGYAHISYDRVSRRGGNRFASSFDGARFFAFTNLTGYVPQDVVGVPGLALSGRLGFRYSREDQDGFSEGALDVPGGVVELGTLSLGAKAASGSPASRA